MRRGKKSSFPFLNETLAMHIVFSLFAADLKKNRAYYLIASLGVAAAVGGVVWNYGSFATEQHQSEAYARRLLGPYDLFVGEKNPYGRGFPGGPQPEKPGKPNPGGPELSAGGAQPGASGPPRHPMADRGMAAGRGGRPGRRGGPPPWMRSQGTVDLGPAVEKLRQTPNIARVDTAFTSRVVLQHKLPWTGPPLSAVMFAVEPDAFLPPAELPADQWLPSSAEADGLVVIDRQQAERMQAVLGDVVSVTGPGARVGLKVCGIVDASRPFMQSGNVYLTRPTAARIMGHPESPPQPNMVVVQLDDPAAKADVLDLPAVKEGRLRVVDSEQIAGGFNAPGRRSPAGSNMGWYVVVLSFAVSFLIVFITLNLGLSNRVRQFGMLRTIGASRRQIAGFLVVESLFLGLLGSAGGIALGAVVLEATTQCNPALFPKGMVLGLPAVVYGLICGLGGALVAACVPAVRAVRQAPLAVMTNTAGHRHTRAIVCAAIAGSLLVLPALLVSLPWDIPAKTRGLLFTASGLPGIFVGCLLLAPAVVLCTTRLFRGPLALVTQLPGELLTSELGRHLRRTAGVTLLMAASVGSFVAVSTWGSTMLRPFLPNEDCPDVAITFHPAGVPPEAIEDVQHTPGFAPGRCLPLYTRQIDLGDKAKAAVKKNEIVEADGRSILLVGLDPEKAFLGDDPLFRLNLQRGSDADAVARLNAGGYCLIPSSFAAQSQLGVGDVLDLGAPSEPDADPNDSQTRRSFVISGIYTTPWHLLTKKGGMRGVHGASMDCQAMVLVGQQDARPLMRNERIITFWANYTDEYRAMPFEERMVAVRSDLGKLVGRFGPGTYVDPQSRQTLRVEAPWFRIGDLGHVISGIHDHAGNIITSMSRLPLWSLSVAALALVNTVITSVRTRRWSLGVMRSMGMSRGQLVRMILAEALLVGLCGCLLGLAAGLYAGWTTARMAHYIFHFSGLNITLVVPWISLGVGLTLALATSVLAALLPALLTARRTPLTLLQEGRLSR